MKRIARVEQNKDNGIYTINIYDIDSQDKDSFVFAATVLTPVEYQQLAWEYGVAKENLLVCYDD